MEDGYKVSDVRVARFPVKLFEVRDRMTCIPVLAVRLYAPPEGIASHRPAEGYLLRRSGFGRTNTESCNSDYTPYIQVTRLTDAETHTDMYHWTRGRTMQEAHRYIQDHWNSLTSGDVIDVEFILGETEAQKVSERISVLG